MTTKVRGFEEVVPHHRQHKDDVKLPKRADSGSAGYDFYTPISFLLQPNEKIEIALDVKAYMQADEVLLLFIRSSIGNKEDIVLANGTGVIDQSYHNNPKNDGNIHIYLVNTGYEVRHFTKGERIVQGVFLPYLVADEDETIHASRRGGSGSSNE